MSARPREATVLVVGNPDPVHVGAHLVAAARALGLGAVLLDVRRANGASRILRKAWWLLDRRPTRLTRFSRDVVRACRSLRPRCVIATGLAPVNRDALRALGALGITRVNYLTDDPWNPAHRARWFFRALSCYDAVFSPRRANLDDLAQLGCRQVAYLPFAYNPEVHYREAAPGSVPEEEFDSDVLFAGGADRDRVRYVAALIRAGFRVALYGGYWERFPETRAHARGVADAETLRAAVSRARIALCLVRRANRDGHAMRTFELPAMGACMLVEDTEEHREIFGEDGRAVMYFRTLEEMVERARWLVERPDERRRLAAEARRLVSSGSHTYADRLSEILMTVGLPAGGRRTVR